MNKIWAILLCIAVTNTTIAQEIDSLQLFLDSLESSLHFQKGEIELKEGLGTLNTPEGFRYLDEKQAEFVIRDLWGNPQGDGTLGMIVPDNVSLMDMNAWAFIITYDEIGYVKDDDAEDIDYDELMTEMKTEAEAQNAQRMQLGFEPISIVGWAAKPYYDKEKNVLHWAKEIRFGETEEHTLNYNVRILGRKGVLVLNAVASMHELAEVEQNINPVLASFSYADGNKYTDFNPDMDEVAAWTVGGLVAGKVLTKMGFFAILLKNLKLILLAIAGVGGAAWRWFKRKTEPPVVRDIEGSSNA